MLRRIKEYNVDGVIFHVLKGCHLNSMDAAKTSVFLKKNNIPMLKMISATLLGLVGLAEVLVILI